MSPHERNWCALPCCNLPHRQPHAPPRAELRTPMLQSPIQTVTCPSTDGTAHHPTSHTGAMSHSEQSAHSHDARVEVSHHVVGHGLINAHETHSRGPSGQDDSGSSAALQQSSVSHGGAISHSDQTTNSRDARVEVAGQVVGAGTARAHEAHCAAATAVREEDLSGTGVASHSGQSGASHDGIFKGGGFWVGIDHGVVRSGG